MKRVFAILSCCAICAAMSTSVFAAETAMKDDLSIYATESEANSVVSQMADTNAANAMNEFGIAVDTSTVMPVYYASLFDYAETGKLEFEPYELDGKQVYMSDAVDAAGNFAGVMEFSTDDVHIYMPTEDKHQSVDFMTNSQ